MQTLAFGLLAFGTVSTANTYLAFDSLRPALGNLTATTDDRVAALNVRSVDRRTPRATSSDPNCPDGWLCNPVPCEKKNCDWCLSFEGVEVCAPSSPDKTKWCGFSPELASVYGCFLDGASDASCWCVSHTAKGLNWTIGTKRILQSWLLPACHRPMLFMARC
jgi:hypothetical protein